jgi:hypothetical protein
MHAKENEDITDLLIPEDELLNFQAPTYNAIRSAYSKSFKATATKKNPIKRIEELFPKQNKKQQQDNDVPGFSIDSDEDPLLI